MNPWLIRRILPFLAADAGGGGGAPPAAPPPAGSDPPATPPPAGSDPPAPPPGTPPAEAVEEEWKGWGAGQLNKETREKHKDGLLELKGKQLGEVFDDFFANRARLQNAVVFPGKDAKPEEIDAFLKRMDIPKTAEEYGLDPKLIPSAERDETKASAVKELANLFRSIGLTKNQAKQMYQQYTNIIKSANEAATTRQKSLADTFDERLLRDTGDEKSATETKEYFKRALIALGDKQLVQELSQSGLMYSTALVRGLADIWKAGNQDPPIPQAGAAREEAKKDALPKGKQFEEAYGGRRK
jgi:predicted esterase YcpF (UPF0227 family)